MRIFPLDFPICTTTRHKWCWFVVVCATVVVVAAYSVLFQFESSLLVTQYKIDDDGNWFNLSSSVFRLYAYSALYDDRSSLLSLPVIRIIAVSDKVEDLKDKNISLHCILENDDQLTAIPMEEDPKPVGFGWPLEKRSAREYVYTCPTIKGIRPRSISFTHLPNARIDLLPRVPVTFPIKPVIKRNFCVCMQVAFGNLDPYRAIEWLEIQKIIGIDFVAVYDLSVSEAGLRVLHNYSEEGFVGIRKTNPIFPNEDRHHLLQGSPVINDCMYRHMHEFKRMVVIDFDEIIMPRRHETLQQLVDYLDETLAKKNSPRANYAFRNNYFFLDLPADNEMSRYLTTLRFRKKVEVSPDGYSVKSIINPQACTHMHNHYCWGLTAEYDRYGNSHSVDPGDALNQHYKLCHFSSRECQNMMLNVTQDDVMLKLKGTLIKGVREKVKLIMGHDL